MKKGRAFILSLALIFFSAKMTLPVFAEKIVTRPTVPAPVEMTVILENLYLDGEISEQITKETIWSMEDFWSKYQDWQLIDMGGEKVVFRREVDDISPLLKANGYFGITEEGVLTIFNGKPDHYNIIQSFFQIDLGRLESNKHRELKKGIPILTKDRYVKVLEVFQSYSKANELAEPK
ncbi:intercompartmental signaling factor BofC [Bacillaceae bacterium Marseille-Q3522]|nr:intercompartmental signaling factor BofC [Bacillaceae bacterium Marseille-Q3522]